jgi:hypothetical protein
VLKLGPDGKVAYSTFPGGGNGDQPRAIAVDPKGNVYVTGRTTSANFPLKNAVQQHLPAAVYSSAGFVTKINADGSDVVYSTFLGGSNGDFGSAIAADALGNAYIGDVTSSGDFPVTANAFQKSFSGAFARLRFMPPAFPVYGRAPTAVSPGPSNAFGLVSHRHP